MKISSFAGINNVADSKMLESNELQEASNVDVGTRRELRRRQGFGSAVSTTAHRHLWQGDGFQIAVKASDLVNAITGASLHAALGTARVWYANLPDGRTAYSNGTLNGLVTAAARTAWGVPLPASSGTPADTAGSLFAGKYLISVTHVRTSDGLEGAPTYRSTAFTVAAGGIALTGLPVLSGYTLNVYLSSHNGGTPWLAGTTATSSFTYTGKNNALDIPCTTDFCYPAPIGRCLALWRGSMLVAVGSVLYCSRFGRYELFDLRNDFKQFSANITLVQPVKGGIFVGTTQELCFLAGNRFDQLVYEHKAQGAVLLGSGVTVPGDQLLRGKGTAGEGQCMVGVVNRTLTAGYGDGSIALLSEGRYQVPASVSEVYASFVRAGAHRIPQYIAIPQ